MGRDSSARIVIKLWAGQRRNLFRFPAGIRDLSSLQICRPALGPTSLLFNGYRGFFPRVKAAGDVKLATYVHLVPRLRMSGTIPLPPDAFTTCNGATLHSTVSILITLHNHNIQFFFKAELSTAKRAPSSVAMQQLMSSALR